eukprot:CAMPEP_0198282630 /NCGR_PEP_ID=MMETSP1449-20131203/2417_1 /TAXON_ID=420275 /ORGANISM="Attheya septentrionalis, Strain CCMP2084" /LENGTH=443 /DNA_ID=CAMNT_0043978963 /DNA_START=224 /DNA_END=1555 /DNA_ORIENTATION=+
MPIRVTLRVKRALPLVHERHPITAKKQRTNDLLTDGSTAGDSPSESALLCEPSYDPHLLHKADTSTSNQKTSQVGTADHAEIHSFNSSSSSIETGLDSLSNQECQINNGVSEFQREEDFENNQQVAPSYNAHEPAAIPFVRLNKNQKKWNERFKELVDFKKNNGHTNVDYTSGPLGIWVHTQKMHERLLREGKYGKYPALTFDRREKLESIGFPFILGPPCLSWDEQFRELLDFKKMNGHTNVPQRFGPLGKWVMRQRVYYRSLKKGKYSKSLTSDRCEKLESIGFAFILMSGPRTALRTPWEQRFQELVDFKKINGHTIVSTNSGPLGTWVASQRREYRLLKEGKKSGLTSDRREKLESIGFTFKCPTNRGPTWDARFQELEDFKKISGHTMVSVTYGPLGQWVSTQRTHYRFLKEGKPSILNIYRREKLESIGFTFTRRPE